MRDFTGQKFGKLTVTGFSHKKVYGNGHSTKSFWKTECSCGNEKVVCGENLSSGNTTSCGCLARKVHSDRMKRIRTKHGLSHTPEYRSYASMISRITKPDERHRLYYEGIKICDRWLGDNGFENFLEDMGPKPNASFSIDRVNNLGDYTPTNCRWASKKQQAQNRRQYGTVVANHNW